ncbi:MAG TPA: antibiotic biosynthesis monooxygenase family protein [Ktedonobacteraceae bacterium]|jgi:heme-degrading monooxygenase HmoA|nr:antibiotic biosynthesis monooxygenase family protein [Ktedonobacteraceae bacterium]
MLIAVNKVSVAPEQRAATVEGFKRAVPAMKQFSGFLGMEIWTEQDGSLLAVSRWTSKEALEEYTNNALFRSHHSGTTAEQKGGYGGAASGGHGQTLYYEAEQLI